MNAPSPIPISALTPMGSELTRPECVAVGADGRVFASHGDELIEIDPDGDGRTFGSGLGESNGLAIAPDGRILVTDFSPRGGLRAVDPDTGDVEDLHLELEGRPVPYTNYPVVDSRGSIWVTSSSQQEDQLRSVLLGLDDGRILRLDPDGTVTVAADGLRYANGLALDAKERYLYCCQTSVGNVVRLPILPDRSLGPAEPYGPPIGARRPDEFAEDPAELGDPAAMTRWGLTDGCGFDRDGNLWVTIVTASRICAITPNQELVVVIDDPEGATLPMPTNISWGGPGLRDLYIGTIGAPHILTLTSPIPGAPLAHQHD